MINIWENAWACPCHFLQKIEVPALEKLYFEIVLLYDMYYGDNTSILEENFEIFQGEDILNYQYLSLLDIEMNFKWIPEASSRP